MTYAIVLNKSDLTRETPKAWGFWESCAWFPKSLCTLQDHAPDKYRLLAPDWLARKNGCANTKYDGIERI